MTATHDAPDASGLPHDGPADGPASRYGGGGRPPARSERRRVERLNRPNLLWGSNGVTFGPDGRLYVAEFLAHRISAVDPSTGEVDIVVPQDSPVQAPDDLAFGADGSMYIADLTPGRVWRRSPGGVYTLVSDEVIVPNGITCVGDRLFVNEMRPEGRLLELYPDGGAPRELTGGLDWGNAMQLGPDGLLYYPHMMSREVWRISPEGGEPELVASDVDDPVAVRFDRAGTLVVLSRGPAGIVTRIDLATGERTLGTSGVAGMDNATFDEENRMYISSYAGGGITEMHEDGRTRELVPRGFNGPFGVAVDLHGTAWAADHFGLARADRHEEPERAGTTTQELIYFTHGIAADGPLLHLTSQVGTVHTHDTREGTTRLRASGLRPLTGVAVASDGALVVAETGGGRVLRIAVDDTVVPLAEGLDHPVDVALDAGDRCYVSEDRLGSVLRIDGGTAVTVAEGLGRPQGLVVREDELFVVEAEHRRLTALSLTTGESRTEAAGLPVGLPPGIVRTDPEPPFGLAAPPPRFAGLAVGPDGVLHLAADGEGTVLRLTPRETAGE